MRAVSPELEAVKDKRVGDAVIGQFIDLPDKISIPKRDDWLRILRIGVESGVYSESDVTAAENSKFILTVPHTPFYHSHRNDGRFEYFIELYRWGGEQLVTYGEYRGEIVLDMNRNPSLAKLMSSNWRNKLPMDMDELSIIYGILWLVTDWEHVTVAEALYVILRDRSRLAKRMISCRKFTVGMHISAARLQDSIREVVTDDSALAWYLTVIENPVMAVENEISDEVIDAVVKVASLYPLDSVVEYLHAGIFDADVIGVGLQGLGTDRYLIDSLLEGEAHV